MDWAVSGMSMSIDGVVTNVLLPLAKFPVLLALPFKDTIPEWIILMLVLYSVVLWCFLNINNRLKKGNLKGFGNSWSFLGNLKDPVAVVTGGSSGLGKAIILELYSRYSKNITIINVDIRKLEIDSDSSMGDRIVFLPCDLSNSDEVENAIGVIKNKYKERVNLIVNNAGIRLPYMDFNHLEPTMLSLIMQVNCYSPLRLMQELPPSNGQCYIVNIASVLGVLSPAKVSAYAASKSALISLHNSFSWELLNNPEGNIRTLLVVAGQLNTEMFGGFRPPRQFFAPVVDVAKLADQIVQQSQEGVRGTLNVPYYSNFAHILMSLPYSLQRVARWFAQMDSCLPDETRK